MLRSSLSVARAGFCFQLRPLSSVPTHGCITRPCYSTTPTPAVVRTTKVGIRKHFPEALDKWLGITLVDNYRRHELEEAAHVLLNSIYMKVYFNNLRKVCELDDTFEMWLIIVYLHVWMLLVKLSNEGRDGKIVSRMLVEVMWKDINLRLGKIQNEVEQHLEINKKMKNYYDLLRTSFIMYDEGLLKGDCELAGSLWNQVYGQQEVDPRALEYLVEYVRFTVARLDCTAMDSLILDPGNVKWPLPDNTITACRN